MDTQSIVRRIAAQDYVVQRDVAAAGPTVAPAIAPLLRDPDDGVRTLAAHCLGFAGGPVAAAALVDAVRDPSLTVAGAALAALERFDLAALPDATAGLLAQLQTPIEPVLRRRIPVVLLKGGAAPAIADVKPLVDPEPDTLVREGLVLLLAKLGDADARDETRTNVAKARGDAVRRWTALFDLVQGPWLAKPLVAWLADEEGAKRIGADGVPNVPQAIRACDVAVNLLVPWTGVRPSFTPSPFSLYTAAQRAEVKDLVEAWLAAHPEHA